MHLSTEERAASWVLELFREVGGDVPEYSSSDKFSINDAVKSYHEKIVLKTLQLEISNHTTPFSIPNMPFSCTRVNI